MPPPADASNASAPSASIAAGAASLSVQAAPTPAPEVPSPSPLPPASNAPSSGVNGAVEPAQIALNAGVPVLPDSSVSPAAAAAPELATQPPAAVKKGRGAGKRLTDRERLEILELFEKSGGSMSNAEIARRYGITRAAIQKLKLKGPEVRARYRYGSAGSRDGRKRGSHVLSVPFERELFEWVRGLKARKVPVPPSLVKEKAKLLVPKYALGDFQASNGWYYNFCKRFNLSTGVLVEEKPPATTSVASGAVGGSSTASVPASHTSQRQQGVTTATSAAYELQLQQQYQQQLAAMTAMTMQQDEADREHESKSDRILALLEQQSALLERQTRVSEEQAETMKRLLELLTTRESALL
ncbi:hypothetical protein BBJ28_00011808 [Nothophytophthora sp. Chile5]|nr:hypothetical protein BBJ28_00011808 [Nothophytophthora sp. Chile5]